MTLDWSGATVLTAAAFEACWETLQLGETPWQLEPPRHGTTASARREYVAEVRAQLARAGPDLPAWLRLLAYPAWCLDVRLREVELVAGVAACRGPDGVLAVRRDGEMALVAIKARAAADAVLSLLGAVRPGPGRPMLVPVAGGPAAPRLTAACRDVQMFGQLGASVAVRDGHRTRRVPRVIGFHRTTAGDYRTVRVNGAVLAVEPATRLRLLADLDGLLA